MRRRMAARVIAAVRNVAAKVGSGTEALLGKPAVAPDPAAELEPGPVFTISCAAWPKCCRQKT